MKSGLKNEGKTRTVRNTRVILLGVLICSALFALSTTLPKVDRSNRESEKIIKNYFRFPKMLTTREEISVAVSNTVVVLFTTNNAGKVNFVLVKTQNEALRSDVEKQFYRLNLPKLKPDVVHSVVLNFKNL